MNIWEIVSVLSAVVTEKHLGQGGHRLSREDDTGPQTQTEGLSVHSTVIMAAPGGSSSALRDEVNDKRAGEGKVC